MDPKWTYDSELGEAELRVLLKLFEERDQGPVFAACVQYVANMSADKIAEGRTNIEETRAAIDGAIHGILALRAEGHSGDVRDLAARFREGMTKQ